MSVYTPRGLKIRLPVEYCFTLISRLGPSKSAYVVLRTVEGLEHIPDVVVLMTGMLGFCYGLNPLLLACVVFVLRIAAFIVSLLFVRFVPLLPAVGTIYSVFSGRGLILVAQVLVALLASTWVHLAAFYAANLVGGLLCELLSVVLLGKMTASEKSFFNSYLLHSRSVGASCDTDVSVDEIDSSNWINVFREYEAYCPESAAKSE